MKRTLIVLGLAIISLVSTSVSVYYQLPKRFSKEEIKSDFKYLRDTLEVVHYL